jgi:hypothetical protein
MNDIEKKKELITKELIKSYVISANTEKMPSIQILNAQAEVLCEEDEAEDSPIPNKYLSKAFRCARKIWTPCGYKELRNAWEGDDFIAERKDMADKKYGYNHHYNLSQSQMDSYLAYRDTMHQYDEQYTYEGMRGFVESVVRTIWNKGMMFERADWDIVEELTTYFGEAPRNLIGNKEARLLK